MTNHPNRGRGSASRNPTHKEIKKERIAAGLSQTAAAELIHSTLRTWQQWEADPLLSDGSQNPNHRRMHPGLWELFKMKAAALGK